MGEAAHPDDGRFIGKPYGAPELFTEVDDLMRNPSSARGGRVSSTALSHS
jgi:hypothetical protein